MPRPDLEALQVLDPPAVIVVGEAEQDRILPSGRHDAPVHELETVTAVHGPQLSASFDSVMVLTHEALLSAQARTYQVPTVGNVYDTCEVSPAEGARAGEVSVLVVVTALWSASLSIWKRLVKPVGVSSVPAFVMRDESVTEVPCVAVVGVMAPAVRFVAVCCTTGVTATLAYAVAEGAVGAPLLCLHVYISVYT